MSFKDLVTRQATKDEHALGELSDSMVEAAFRRNLITRFVRTLLIIFVTFMATTAFVQSAERERCEQGKVFLRSYVEFVSTAAAAREVEAKEGDNAKERKASRDTAKSYREQEKLLRPGIDVDCSDRYPIVPFLGV